MNQNITYVEELRSEFIKEITTEQKTEQLLKYINETEQTAGDYQGRVILELIQNMDDQGNHNIIHGLIKIEGNNLIVCNQGKPFSEDGIKSVHMASLSTKQENENIGNKGLGFRSILKFADKVQIFSGNFAVEFSEEFAQKEFDKIKTNPQIQKTIAKRNKASKPTYIPMLLAPHSIDYATERTSNGKYNIDGTEYDTYIKLHLRDNAVERIKTQIRNFIDTNSLPLLFLRSLKEITFKYDDVTDVCSVRQVECKETSDNPCITKWETIKSDKFSDGKMESACYYMYRKNDMAVCFPEHIKHIDLNTQYNLFAFFPMNNQPCDFPVILHADKFHLVANRNALDAAPENGHLIQGLMDLLLEAATYFAKPEYGTMAIDMLSHSTLSKPFSDFKDEFYTKLRARPIIPTLQNTYKSLNSKLRVQPEVFSDCQNVFECIDNTISNTIKQKLSPELQSYISDFTPNDLYDEINQISDNFDSDTRALLFYNWKNFYKPSDLMPKILKNTNGIFFTYDSAEHDRIHLSSTDMKIQNIPDWAMHNIVDIDDKDALINHISKLDSYDPSEKAREIQRHYPLDFVSDDITDLLPPINSKINNDYDRAIDFVVFLLQNLNISNSWNTKRTPFKFPTANNSVQDSNTLYFGKSYGDSDSKLCELFGLTEFIPLNELKERINFDITPQQIIELLGENYGITIKPTWIDDYPLTNINAKFKQTHSDIFDTTGGTTISSITTTHIPNLEIALNAVKNSEDTIRILELLNSEQSKEQIKSNYVPIKVKYNTNHKRINNKETKFDNNNYDRFLLYNTSWLVINGTNYTPRELLLKKVHENIKFIPDEWASKYNQLFQSIGVKTNIWETDDDIFYTILLNLPGFDKDGKISKSIYSNLEKNYNRYNTSQCLQKSQFLTTGQLFAKTSTRSDASGEFRAIKEVKFASSKLLNRDKQWLIAKPPRTGDAEEFKKIFGIEKFEEKINLTKTITHSLQPEFDALWNEFKPFAEIYATKNQNLQNKLADLAINIISYAEDNGKPLDNPENYLIIQQGTQWYIYLSPENTLNLAELSRAIGNILEVIANSTDKVKQDIQLLFNAQGETERLKVLEEDLAYDTSGYQNSQGIKDSFITSIKKALNEPDTFNSTDVDSIDFSTINSAESIENIINVLRSYGLSYKDIKDNGFEIAINFNEYHYNKVLAKLEATERAFEQELFVKLQNDTDEKQQLFFSNIEVRKNISVVEDDIDCDYNKYCPDIDSTAVDIAKILHNNLSNFKLKYPTYSDDNLNNLSLTEKSMLLFNQVENFKQCLDQRIKNENATETQKKEQKRFASYTLKTDDSNIKAVAQSDKKSSNTTKYHVTITGQKLAQTQEKNGADAEEAVFNKLTEDEAYTDIEWVSGIGFKKGKGTRNNDSLGYDMTYVQDGKKYFAEVKSASINGNAYEFFVSDNEYKVAKEKLEKDNYDSYVFILVLPNHEIQFIHRKSKIQEIIQSAKPESYKFKITL